MISFRYFIFSLLFLTGCCNRISVHTEYLSVDTLASYIVGSPDPRKLCPDIGQRLILSWTLPRDYLCYSDLRFIITIRFRNHTEKLIEVPVTKLIDGYEYRVVNDAYDETCGIQTYKVDLLADGEVVEELRHQMWTESIQFQSEKKKV